MVRELGAMMMVLFATSVGGVEIIAHRGASADAPENTLASVNLGWKQDADAVEIDIHQTADGQIVAIHDNDTKRVAGKPVAVVDQTLAELQKLDVGRWKAERFAGERIPTLAEILRTIPAGKRLFIEVKTEAEILPELQRVLVASGQPPEQTPLIGFSFEAMKAAKQRMPAVKVYWLVSLKRDEKTGELNYSVADLVRKAQGGGFDGLDLGNSPPLTREDVELVKKAGLGLYVWTVNDPALARDYAEMGVDGVTTDRPEFLRNALADPPPSRGQP